MLTAIALFAAAVVAILLAGPRMAKTSDRLAKVTGLGGALFGVIFLSLATDLPEVALTPAAVLSGNPRLAVGGLLGGAAGQLVLMAAADVAFTRGKLLAEVHLLSSLGPCAVMIAVLAVPPLLAAANPRLGSVGLGAALIVVAYVGTLAAVRGVKHEKHDVPGPEDRDDVAGEEPIRTGPLWLRFAGYAVVLAAAGVALEASTETIGEAIGFTQTAAGALLAGLATSLPELVTAVAAARAGALSLVVGDLIGSSALDVALLAVADLFYTQGSIFDLLGGQEFTLIGVCLALTSLLIVGLARRKPVERPAVTMETWLMLAVYALRRRRPRDQLRHRGMTRPPDLQHENDRPRGGASRSSLRVLGYRCDSHVSPVGVHVRCLAPAWEHAHDAAAGAAVAPMSLAGRSPFGLSLRGRARTVLSRLRGKLRGMNDRRLVAGGPRSSDWRL